MAATRISEREFRRQVTEARKRGRIEMARELQAKSVRYDRDTRRIVVDLKNGSTFIFPPRLVEGLAGACPQDIAEVELGPRGSALFWKKLDQHYSLAGLTAGAFGSKAWMVEHLQSRQRDIEGESSSGPSKRGKGWPAAQEGNRLAAEQT
jgi:hypothetical protein